jgi:hypothetical protein
VALLVGLGAATTVGVAWGIAVVGVRTLQQAEEDEFTTRCDDTGTVYWVQTSYFSPGSLMLYTRIVDPDTGTADGSFLIEWGMGMRRRLPAPQESPRVQFQPVAPPATVRREMQFGWPLRCFWGAEDADAVGSSVYDLGRISIWRVMSTGPRAERWPAFVRGGNDETWTIDVPLGVMRGPLAISTAVYASAWWSVLFGVGITRRELRRRRGQCVVCAYSRTGLAAGAVCPECGS